MDQERTLYLYTTVIVNMHVYDDRYWTVLFKQANGHQPAL